MYGYVVRNVDNIYILFILLQVFLKLFTLY